MTKVHLAAIVDGTGPTLILNQKKLLLWVKWWLSLAYEEAAEVG